MMMVKMVEVVVHGSPPPSDLVVAFSSVSSSIQTISHARTRSVYSASRWCLCCCSGCRCRGMHSPSLAPSPAASGGSGSWRLPLPGTCSPGGAKQGCASRFKGGFTNKAVRVCGGPGRGSIPPTAQFASHTGRCSLADIRDFKKRPESSIHASGHFMKS